MQTKTFITMAVATVGIAVFATIQMRSRTSATQAAGTGELFLPSFEASINDVAAVHVSHEEDSFTLARQDDGWGLEEAGGYPVDGGKVTQFLFALKDASTLERKTANPGRHEMLGLAADTPDATEVRVTKTDGSELAALLIGNQRQSQGRTSSEAYYVRRPDEDQTWLVKGKLGVDKTRSAWLEKEIVNVDRERIQSVEIVHADGETVHVSKPDETATDFELHDIPEGKELRYASVAGSLAAGLANLTLEDVVAAGAVTFDDPPLARCTFKTFDGLVLNATMHEADDKLYARFAVAYEEPVVPPTETVEPPPELEVETPAEDEAPSPEEVQAEVRAIDGKVADWTYVLPSWKRSTFIKRLDDMLKDVEPAPEAEAPQPELPELDPTDLGIEPPLTSEQPTEDDAALVEDVTSGEQDNPPAADEDEDGGN